MTKTMKRLHYIVGLTAAKQFLILDEYDRDGELDKATSLGCAIYNAYVSGVISNKTQTLTLSMLRKRLGNYPDIRTWSIMNAETAAEVNIYANSPVYEIQAYRHAWVDSMIEEFTTKLCNKV